MKFCLIEKSQHSSHESKKWHGTMRTSHIFILPCLFSYNPALLKHFQHAHRIKHLNVSYNNKSNYFNLKKV